METLQPKLRFQEFDGNWKLKKLGEVSTITTGSTPSTIVEEYYNGEKLFVSPVDLQGNRYVNKTKTTLTELGFTKGRKISKGSVLFVCIGSTIGKVGIAGKECLTNQQINAISGNSNYYNDFIYSLLEKNAVNIKLLAGTQAVPQLNKTDFSNIILPFPSLEEQTRIANFLSSVDEKINLLKEKKSLLEDYKKGIMQKIFNQEIRFKDDNGNVFEDWEEVKLSDFAEVNKGNQLNKDDLNDFETYPCISGGIEPSGYTNKYNREENTIIISEGGNSCGYVNFVKTKFWCGGHCYSIDLMNDYSKSFIYQLLKFSQDEIMRLRVGSGLPNIQKKDLKNLIVNLPSSLEEQTKIANFLSAIDEKIELVSNQIQDTQEYKKGLLQQMFV